MNDATCSTWPAPPPAYLVAESALPLLLQHEPRIAKTCTCCGRAFTVRAWLSLAYVGQQGNGEGGWLNLRNCDKCGSTLAEPESL